METPTSTPAAVSAPARARPYFHVTINVGEREAQPLLPVTTVARSATRPRVSGFTWDTRPATGNHRLRSVYSGSRRIGSCATFALANTFPRRVLTRPHPRRRCRCNIDNVARAGQTARRWLPPLICSLANKIDREIKATFAALVESVSDFAARLRQPRLPRTFL